LIQISRHFQARRLPTAQHFTFSHRPRLPGAYGASARFEMMPAFQLQAVRLLIEGPAAPDLVIAELQRRIHSSLRPAAR
jgi:hypothetical protein